ncbi:divergent polysaccharide deacetylase family protein [Desulfovibrio sp. OttesenSCG-928-G15]|nr:divergent polysaccharide deacetylase family protein [Desulfovibrio sp. OttesenSCG-928-G15]
MSPPRKTTSSKTGAKKAPAKTTTRKSPTRKKTTRKKKSGGQGKGLIIAFVAGLLIACAGIWFLRDYPMPWDGTKTEKSRLSAQAPKKSSQAKPAAKNGKDATAKAKQGDKTPAKEAKTASKTQESAKQNSAKTAKPGKDTQLLPKDAQRGAATDPIKPEAASAVGTPAASAQAAQPKPTGKTSQALAERAKAVQEYEAKKARADKASQSPTAENKKPAGDSGAVASALSDLQTLAYEEDIATLPLADRIRQVDYALMQAAWIRKLPASAMRLAQIEDKSAGKEKYKLQKVEVLPGSDAGHYVDAVKDCLALWAEGATVSPGSSNTWTVSLGGLQTHSLKLYPGKTAFPSPATAQTRPLQRDVASPSAQGTASPRLRADGEAPKLVIVIDDLGASAQATKTLLELDYPVTFAFWPHGANTRDGAIQAHARGMEIIVHQPMEPIGYPKVRPGPNVLLTGMDEGRIRSILDASLKAVPHAIGMNNHMGSRFTQDRAGVRAVIRFLQERGLFMLDSLTHASSVFGGEGKKARIENYCRNVFLDVTHSKGKILEQLRRAERIAAFTGQAIAIGHPLPETLAALKDWQRLRNKNVRIVRLRDLRQD